MRTQLALALGVCAGIAAAGEPAPAETVDVYVAEGRLLAGRLGAELKTALMAAVAEGGTTGALDVCRLEAPAIAGRISRADLRVGRTALRVRNPLNAADDEARAVLEDFERRLASGEPADRLEDLRETDTGMRYMKAIAMQPMCVACHGPAVEPALAAAIRQRYPQDQAVGFAPDGLRGAFVVEWQAAAAE